MEVRNRYFEQADTYRCPVCMCEMVEVDGIEEDGFLFVWYECSRSACNEQLLEKKSQKAMAV